MGNTKQINIKTRTYYFFNMKNHTKTLVFIISDTSQEKRISGCESINSVNPLYLMTGEVDGYIKESNGNKYLTFASTDNKKVLEKYTKLWEEIKYHIQTINAGKSGEYDKDCMKIKLKSDDDLPLNKILKLHMLTVIVRSVFEDDGKYYPQVYLDECLYEV